MNDMICLVGSAADSTLSALAHIWRAEGQSVFVCALPASTPNNSVDLILEGAPQQAILERMAAKARVVVRLGMHSLGLRLDAGCSAPQILILQAGEGGRIWKRVKEGHSDELACMRLVERYAHAVLATIAEQAVCLRPVHILPDNSAQAMAHAVHNALANPLPPERPLSQLFMRPCPAALSPALLALSTEILALRPDAALHFKALRDAGHVTASVLLPWAMHENLPLPGGKHLEHFMRFTSLCPLELWQKAPVEARDVLQMAVAHFVLHGQAEALECLLAHADIHESVAYATLLCGSGCSLTGMSALKEHLSGRLGTCLCEEAGTSSGPITFVHAFAHACETFSQDHATKLLHATSSLPRMGGQMVWGCSPILNNKYWSLALQQGGTESCTLMPDFYTSINTAADYDLYFRDIIPPWAYNMREGAAMTAFLYVACNASIVHMPFRGGPLSGSSLSHMEPEMLHTVGVKSVIIPYGSDAYMYSRLGSPTLAHVLNISYPAYARDEETVCRNVQRWSAKADFVLGGAMTVDNGFPRWDALVVAPFHIDTKEWAYKLEYSHANGRNGQVRILHCPNHRAFKGTDYIIQAVEKLRAEGLNVELVLLERVQNHVVLRTMLEVDILVDQCLAHYALNAVEGMASGLPVCSNLEEPDLTVLRRFSYLDECPVVSVTPETLVERLRPLVYNADLRRRLGQAGRLYVQKYHSFEAARHLFGAIHSKLLDHGTNNTTDVQYLYHPLLSDYVKQNPIPRELDKSRIRPKDIRYEGINNETH